ncbi:hypothetical protein J7E79_30530 [Bacillus sp. ISL-40]|uniref:hypothetical protein n=1 Tax=unclassified Bacillus (in: firmicutes) TaxID=185979 RepID=UPI001BE56D4D|nr:MULTISPECIES: hypothetical protein [unclassified Bacillus (in: firmicutes)]MBT2701587.1 hypothetical protein [Bacillus sp. ISL-40]MBT2744704.1 hypothetical protein [Bacillus sp. ISL-77]
MQMFLGKGELFIVADENVAKYAKDYRSANMEGYDLSNPSAKELRKLYNEAQRIFYVVKAKGGTTEECYAARTELADKYMRYKDALIAHYVGHTIEPKPIDLKIGFL